MMIYFNKTLCLVFLLVTAHALPSLAGASHTLEAEGVAVIRGDALGSARKAALQDAQKRVVEQAISILVNSQTRIENHQIISDKILPKTRGYIKQHHVTGETEDSGLLRVHIKADIDTELLTKDLEAIGIHPGRTQKFRSVNITVTGLNKKQYAKFKEVLSKVSGIKGVREKSFNGKIARISADSKSNTQILSNELLLKDFGNYSVEVVSSTANSLALKVK